MTRRGFVRIGIALFGLLGACSSKGRDPAVTAPAPGSAAPTAVLAPAPTATPGAGMPEVPLVGYVVADGVVATVSASRTALTVEGVQVGGTAQLATAVHAQPRRAALAIAADADLPVSLIVQIVAAIAPEGGEVSLLARSGSHQVRVPIMRPPATPSAGLGMIVHVSVDAMALWSMSKDEGSAGTPKVAVRGDGARATAEIAAALAEIVNRRWADGAARAPEDRAIVIEVANGVSLRTIAELLGAVRATAEGTELFPRVFVTTG